MTTVTESLRRPARQLPGFYLAMAGIFAVIAFAGFMNRFDGPALTQLHAILLFGWMALFVCRAGSRGTDE